MKQNCQISKLLSLKDVVTMGTKVPFLVYPRNLVFFLCSVKLCLTEIKQNWSKPELMQKHFEMHSSESQYHIESAGRALKFMIF